MAFIIAGAKGKSWHMGRLLISMMRLATSYLLPAPDRARLVTPLVSAIGALSVSNPYNHLQFQPGCSAVVEIGCSTVRVISELLSDL